jgi:hypothetical protein
VFGSSCPTSKEEAFEKKKKKKKKKKKRKKEKEKKKTILPLDQGIDKQISQLNPL